MRDKLRILVGVEDVVSIIDGLRPTEQGRQSIKWPCGFSNDEVRIIESARIE